MLSQFVFILKIKALAREPVAVDHLKSGKAGSGKRVNERAFSPRVSTRAQPRGSITGARFHYRRKEAVSEP